MNLNKYLPTSQASDTLTFHQAIPSFEEFVTSPVAIETSTSMFVYGTNGAVVPKETWTPEVFRLINRRYKNWEIANTMVDDFLDLLWEKIEIHTPNYWERRSRYAQLLKMTDKELLSQSEFISNYVDHTDVEVTEVFEPLKNISNQTSSKQLGDYSGRLRSQIRAMQETLIDDFLGKFRVLFLRVTNKSNITY